MPFTSDLVHELNTLIRFDLATSQQGIKVHKTADPAVIAATTEYGIPFTGAVAQANIFAVQFHPEKSAQAGLQLLSNFMSWKP